MVKLEVLILLVVRVTLCSAIRLRVEKKQSPAPAIAAHDEDLAKTALAQQAASGLQTIIHLGPPGRHLDRVSDQFLAAHPEYEEVVINEGEFQGNMSFRLRSNASKLFGLWFRTRNQFAFPNAPVQCEDMQVMKVGSFLGSQVNVGIRHIKYTRKPVINVLQDGMYGAPGHNREETLLAQELDRCMVDEDTSGCMLLRNVDCFLPKHKTQQKEQKLEEDESMSLKELCHLGLSEDDCAQVVAEEYQHPPALHGSVDYSVSPFLNELALTSYTRVGAPLRRAIRKKIQDFLAVHGEGFGFRPEEPCVAMHVRLGDKVPECENAGQESSCSFLTALPKYVPKAHELLEQLGKKGAIFVLSDNATVIEKFKRENPQSRIFGMHGSSPGTVWTDPHDELVTLLASLELAKKCGAFVGNSESEVSELAIMFMCRAQGQCPAAFSFQDGAPGSAESRVHGSPVAPHGILSQLQAAR